MSDEETRLEERRRTREDGAASRMYSLVEVAQQTGIPMPILLRYKREHPERIPSDGVGSQQRFPEAAFEAFLEIQREEEAQGQDLPRRGGFGLLSLPKLRKRTSEDAPAEQGETEPPRDARAEGAAPAAPAPQPADDTAEAASRTARGNGDGGGRMLKLTEISERLGIPYPTAARYASQYADRIPHEGHGRSRRFPPEALDVFRRIRRESKPGRPPKRKQQAGAFTPAPAPAPARPRDLPRENDRSTAPATPSVGGGVTSDLPGRIAALERSQQSLADEVRRLAEEVRQPVTVFARKL